MIVGKLNNKIIAQASIRELKETRYQQRRQPNIEMNNSLAGAASIAVNKLDHQYLSGVNLQLVPFIRTPELDNKLRQKSDFENYLNSISYQPSGQLLQQSDFERQAKERCQKIITDFQKRSVTQQVPPNPLQIPSNLYAQQNIQNQYPSGQVQQQPGTAQNYAVRQVPQVQPNPTPQNSGGYMPLPQQQAQQQIPPQNAFVQTPRAQPTPTYLNPAIYPSLAAQPQAPSNPMAQQPTGQAQQLQYQQPLQAQNQQRNNGQYQVQAINNYGQPQNSPVVYPYASNTQMQGPNAQMLMPNAQMQGPNAYIQGSNAQIQGPNAQIQGSNAQIQGPNAQIQGPNVFNQNNQGNNYQHQSSQQNQPFAVYVPNYAQAIATPANTLQPVKAPPTVQPTQPADSMSDMFKDLSLQSMMEDSIIGNSETQMREEFCSQTLAPQRIGEFYVKHYNDVNAAVQHYRTKFNQLVEQFAKRNNLKFEIAVGLMIASDSFDPEQVQSFYDKYGH